jgi:hypothetical protein
MKRVSLIFVLAILLIVPFIYSAGESTGGDSNTNDSTKNNTNNSSNSLNATNSTNPGFARVNCEAEESLRERIRCRLENKGNITNESSVPEACREIERQPACVALYRSSVGCYLEENYKDKKECFLRQSGILQGGTLRSIGNESKLNYTILLLYEVQERIENMYEKNLLTSNEASSLIEKITNIKKKLYEGVTKGETMSDIKELREDYFEAIK